MILKVIKVHEINLSSPCDDTTPGVWPYMHIYYAVALAYDAVAMQCVCPLVLAYYNAVSLSHCALALA